MTRANARELAVHLIYSQEFTGDEPEAVIASRLLWGTETAADLAGKGIRTGVCFIVTFFKSFSFVFPIHDDPPEDEWSELREERRMFLPDLPVRPHTPVIKLSFSKKSPFLFRPRRPCCFPGYVYPSGKCPISRGNPL